MSLPQLGKPLQPNKDFWEQGLWQEGFTAVAGLDEAGRGAWAGPVAAAAVVFKPGTYFPEIDDSKNLTPQKRDVLFDLIRERAQAYAVSLIPPTVIDEINILQASLQAMREAVAALCIPAEYLLVDGNQGVGLSIPQKLLVKGDSLSLSIGAASILAKVTRDRFMVDLEKEHPQFRFSKHKGYGTAAHQREIEAYGILPCHRRSFEPIRVVAMNGSLPVRVSS